MQAQAAESSGYAWLRRTIPLLFGKKNLKTGKSGNAVSQPLAGVIDLENPSGATFPDLNDPATLARLNLQLELTQTNKILPEPCDFLFKEALPPCSVIRPTSTALGGAVAT